MKTFYITSTITIEAESKEEADKKLRYTPENYMEDLIRNAEIDEA